MRRSGSARGRRSTSRASRRASSRMAATCGARERVTVAYGQGVSSTSIQLVSAVNTIANDGVYVAPEAGQVDRRRRRRRSPTPRRREPRVVVVAEAAAQMQQMMRRSCAPRAPANGPRSRAVDRRQDRHRLQGARTTARTSTTTGERIYYASFVGFFPAEDPQVTVLVSVDEPPAGDHRPLRRHRRRPGVRRAGARRSIHELGHRARRGSTGCEPGVTAG